MENTVHKRHITFFLFLCCCAIGWATFFSSPVFAAASGGGDCETNVSLASGAGGGCDNCISAAMYQNNGAGSSIITAMLSTMDNVLNNVEHSFFNGIVGSTTFQRVIGTAIVLYVALYGLMIMTNLASVRTGEVANRLIKIGMVYILTAPGAWSTLQTWLQNPIVGTMNQLIKEFEVTAEGGSAVMTVTMLTGSGSSMSVASGSISSGAGMDPGAFSNMFGSSLTTVFSVKMFTAIESMSQTGFFGWLVSAVLLWSLVEFFLMMLGAIITYAKAIIGLAFLFGIAPLFFCFLLFEKTRQIFFVWLSHVITFALQPMLLFAFLSFYVALINDAVPYLFKTDASGAETDFCWLEWFSLPGSLWQVYSFHPTYQGAEVNGGWSVPSGGVLPSPVNMVSVIYFLMLCHLAKTFTGYIAQLSRDIGEGMGPGVTTAGQIEKQATKTMQKIGGGMKSLRKKK